jgi:hypothetical protein
MKARKSTLKQFAALAVVVVLATAAIVPSWSARSAPGSTDATKRQAPAADAPVGTSGHVSGDKFVAFENGANAIITVSVLAAVQLAQGGSARSVCMETDYYDAEMHLLGGGKFHNMLDTGSTEAVEDLGTEGSGIDIDPGNAEVMRAYGVRIAPRQGLTWGDVRDFDNDVVIETWIDEVR